MRAPPLQGSSGAPGRCRPSLSFTPPHSPPVLGLSSWFGYFFPSAIFFLGSGRFFAEVNPRGARYPVNFYCSAIRRGQNSRIWRRSLEVRLFLPKRAAEAIQLARGARARTRRRTTQVECHAAKWWSNARSRARAWANARARFAVRGPLKHSDAKRTRTPPQQACARAQRVL